MGLVLGLARCNSANIEAKKEAPAVPVSVVAVERRDVPVLIQALGTVEATSSVAIVPQVTGRITSVGFKEGDRVHKGDVLFTIDTRPYNASLAVAQAELARNQVVAEQAAIEASRYAAMADQGLTSSAEAAQHTADSRASEAGVAAARAQIAASRLDVQLTTIRSPLEGRSGRLLVTPGNVVRANEVTPLVVIKSLAPVKVRFAIDQDLFPRLRLRMAEQPLRVTAKPRGVGAATAAGELTFFDNAVDPATGMLTLLATFPNHNEELWPGSFADVALTLDVDKAVLVAPETGVAEGQQGAYAFVVDSQDVAHLRHVSLRRRTETLAIIDTGLALGDRVVVDGMVRLKDGARVTIKTPALATPETAAVADAPTVLDASAGPQQPPPKGAQP